MVRLLARLPADPQPRLQSRRETQLAEENLPVPDVDLAMQLDILPHEVEGRHGALLQRLGVVPPELGVVVHLDNVGTVTTSCSGLVKSGLGLGLHVLVNILCNLQCKRVFFGDTPSTNMYYEIKLHCISM